MRALLCEGEDTGNPVLAARALSMLDARVPGDRRYSVVHGGRKLMLDRLLISQRLSRALTGAEIFNQDLADETRGPAPLTSFHAPVVARFELAP